jgi:hypothetical protein
MTAPAAAPTSGPVAPAAPRAAAQPPADRFAFAAMLDSLPGAPTKAGAAAGEKQAPPSNESPQEESSRGQASHHSLLSDSALFASLPFALRVASMMDERPQAGDSSPSLTSPADEGPETRGRQRAACRRRQGGDCRATDWRTRLPLGRLRHQLYAPSRSEGRKRSRCWFHARRGQGGESLARRRSGHGKRDGPRADRPSRGRAPVKPREPHARSGARGGAQRTKARRLGAPSGR